MRTLLRPALIAALLAACAAPLPARAQSSLGQPGALPPPRPIGVPATPPVATPTPPHPPQGKPAPHATPTLQPRPGKVTQRPATAPRPTTPGTTAAGAPHGSAQGTGQPAARPAPRRAPAAGAASGAAAGATAGTAAGAAAVTRPPEPAPAEATPAAPRIGTETKLPLPRFASLGSNRVNLRVGPDLRFRADWEYQRKDLPVQIIDEHQIWRRIRDPEGTEGWVQRPLLSARRTFVVQGEERALRTRPDEGAEVAARLKPGVIGVLRRCEAGIAWCEVRIGEYRGYVRRADIWGVGPNEALE